MKKQYLKQNLYHFCAFNVWLLNHSIFLSLRLYFASFVSFLFHFPCIPQATITNE